MLNLFYIPTESSHLNLNLMSELVSNKSDERLFSKSSSSLQLPRTLAVAHAHLSPSQKPCQHRSLGLYKFNGGTTPQLEVLVVFHAIRWRSPSLNFKSQQQLLVAYSPAEKTAFYFIIIVAHMI